MKDFKLRLVAFPLYLVACLPAFFLFGMCLAFTAFFAFNAGSHALWTVFGAGSLFAGVTAVFAYGTITQTYLYGRGEACRPAREGWSNSSNWEQDWTGRSKSMSDIEFDPLYVNPATGLLMVGGMGGFDSAGNTFGSDNSHDSDSYDMDSSPQWDTCSIGGIDIGSTCGSSDGSSF